MAAIRRDQARRWAAHLCLIVVIGAFGVTTAVSISEGTLADLDSAWAVAFLGFAGVGWFLVQRIPSHPVAWILLGAGTMVVLAQTSDSVVAATASPDTHDLGVRLARLAQDVMWVPAIAAFGVFLPLLIPTGRLPSRRWRPIATGALVCTALAASAAVVRPGPIGEELPLANPLGVAPLDGVVAVVDAIAFPVLALLAIAAWWSMVVRYRRGSAVERAQLRWVAVALSVIALFLFLPSMMIAMLGLPESEWTNAVGAVGLLTLPLAIAIAVLRHRLFDIDAIIHRGVIATVAGVLLGGLYVIVTNVLRGLVGLDRPGAAPLLATGAVVAASQPLVAGVRSVVDRSLFGYRRDPYRVVHTLGDRLAAMPATPGVLDDVIGELSSALKLPWVAVFDTTNESISAHGQRIGRIVEFEMRHRGVTVGRLGVSTRSPGETFRKQEVRLLQGVANHMAPAVEAASLSMELQRSRQRLVEGVETERRRLRRDLHDGLGPSLAGAALQLHGVLASLGDDSVDDGVRHAVERVIGELERSTGEVRRVVEGLRPPALDELGLGGALARQAQNFGTATRIDVIGPPADLELPAALEVAAYLIAVEAITNVSRHAAADSCSVRLEQVGNDLVVTVSDDGRGFDLLHCAPGVGRSSMRERAGELGGVCTIRSGPGRGTTVTATIPLVTS